MKLKEILSAAENGDVETVATLLAENPALIDCRDSDGYTALHRAAYNNHGQVVQLLLNKKADVNGLTCDAWTPLHSAARWGATEAGKHLIANNAHVNAKSIGRVTPLHLAASSREDGALYMAEMLLLHPQIDISIVNESGDTALKLALRTGEKMGRLFSTLCAEQLNSC